MLGDGPFDFVVMERIEAGESSVDGYAHEGSVVAMHAKTRENAVTGLAMDFRVIEAPDLLAHAAALVDAMGLRASGGLVRAGIARYTNEADVEALVVAVGAIAGSA